MANPPRNRPAMDHQLTLHFGHPLILTHIQRRSLLLLLLILTHIQRRSLLLLLLILTHIQRRSLLLLLLVIGLSVLCICCVHGGAAAREAFCVYHTGSVSVGQ